MPRAINHPCYMSSLSLSPPLSPPLEAEEPVLSLSQGKDNFDSLQERMRERAGFKTIVNNLKQSFPTENIYPSLSACTAKSTRTFEFYSQQIILLPLLQTNRHQGKSVSNPQPLGVEAVTRLRLFSSCVLQGALRCTVNLGGSSDAPVHSDLTPSLFSRFRRSSPGKINK